MHPLPAKRIIKILITNGFKLARQKGSHQIYRHNVSGVMIAITEITG